MPAYVLVDLEILDEEDYREYRAKAPPMVKAHGGRYLVRGGKQTHVEAGWDLHRTVILEFPSVAAAQKWYDAPEYQKILPIRLRSTKSRMVFLEGVDPHGPLPA
jgi:uncharacterized protein (DUF1330 family)